MTMSLSGPPGPDTSAVRDALRRELIARGHAVASDTFGARSDLYIVGDNDLAVALFEFKTTAHEVWETMYNGSWTEGLPPRFAVLPNTAAEEEAFELIEQMGVVPLLWVSDDGSVRFHRLDQILAEHL